MEKQESAGFIEICLRLMNNNLKHFKLWLTILLLPTIAAFVMVMWVIKPMYSASATVTPPTSTTTSLSGLSSMLGGSASGIGSMLGLSGNDEDENAVWTILNSWELHNEVIEKFDLKRHYKFKGEFHSDLLKKFRKNYGVALNKEQMFDIYVEDEDYRLAAEMVSFILVKADSAFNAYKTAQARQSRIYFQTRLDSCEHALDSLLNDFAKFQEENNFYDPEIQLESTLKYLSSLQVRREEVAMEMAYEKADRGEGSKRYDELHKRYKGVNNALNATLKGKNDNVGMVSLKKSPQLSAEYLRRETEVRVQEAMYKLLRQQSEQMRLEESKMLTNLHILVPPWENNKKVYPLRGVTLVFVFAVAFLLATLICNIIGYLETEKTRGTPVANEWNTFRGFFRKSKD
ncbi:MAG: Wzz/FepE/Etk N-terminal domain-containing protein [Fibrobacter sp.]|nr:Wzz/FepE/Etk N-terminal domain-containing protein [Fibrobacter sp.]